MKIQIALLLTSLLSVCALAQAAPKPPITVAVSGFTGDADTASYGSKVTTLVTASLTTETNLILVERSELNKALNEQSFGVSGMVSSDAAARLGQVTGAKVLVAGRVINTGGNRLVIIANIIGTENARLFAVKVEGTTDGFMDSVSSLSRKIARTISDQTTNLVLAAEESKADRLSRVIKNINGTNRPSVSIKITQFGHPWSLAMIEGELGSILLKAGFTVVDDSSDRKPDIQITGRGELGAVVRHAGLFSASYAVDVKIQERRTGNIIAFDNQESTATDVGREAAKQAAAIRTTDDLAERLLPILAK